MRAAPGECQGYEKHSGETSGIFFAYSLRYLVLVVDDEVAAPSPPKSDLLRLLNPVVFILPITFHPSIIVIGALRLAQEFTCALHSLLPPLLPYVRRA